MPNLKSAIKRVRQEKKKNLHNKSYKSMVKTTIKKFLDHIKKEELDKAKAALPGTISVLDKAAQKGIYHMNNISRKKSALYAKIKALSQTKQEESAPKT